MATEARRYHFGSIQQRGVVLGLRGGQLAVLVTAGVVGVGLVRTGNATGLLLSVGMVALGTLVAFVPFRGATVEQWAPTLAQWGRGAGRRRWLVRVPPSPPGRSPNPRTRARDMPPRLAGLAVFEIDAATAGHDQPVGILHDPRAGTFSAVLEVRGGAFALLDLADKERRLASWANVLASFGRRGSMVARLQWIERTFPAGSNRILLPDLDPAATGRTPAGCVESYRELIDRAGPATQAHETLLVVTIQTRKLTRTRSASGIEPAAGSLIGRELRLLQGQLRSADLIVEAALSARACEAALWRSFVDRPELETRGDRRSWPWPVATEVTWGSYRTDSVWHATYWMAEWPRVEVGPDFLAPLLLQSSGRRTVSVTMSPSDPLEAARSVEAAKTADVADGELRRRAGFLNSARRQRESEHLLRRETELAEGHSDYRFAGFVTVTAAEPDALLQSCAEVEQLAYQAHVELRRLYGRQDLAFTWTLPLGRGLA